MVERYIYSSVFIFGNVKVGPNTKTAFHQQMIKIYGYDTPFYTAQIVMKNKENDEEERPPGV